MTALKQFCQRNLYLYFFILLFSILLPSYGLIILTVIGLFISLFLLIKCKKRLIQEVYYNRYLYVNLAFLIPVGIAMIDTLYPDKRTPVFLTILLYLFIGFIPAYLVTIGENFKKLEMLIFCGLVFICIDAIAQWQFNYHSLGYNPLIDSRVRGIFGEWYHLSYFLGTYAPIMFFFLLEKLEQKTTPLRIIATLSCTILLIIGVFIGGARAGVISLAISVLLFIIYLFQTNKIKHKLKFFGVLLLVLIVAGVFLSQSTAVQERFIKAIASFDQDDFWFRFTTWRTNIWYVGFKEIPNYWFNGVGTRGFDALYQTYPEDYKLFVKIWHPHLHGLEVMIETGIIGFIPYLAVCVYLLIKIFKSKAGNAWLMMAFVAIMPINTHVGLYHDYWLPIALVPMMIGLALAYQQEKQRPAKLEFKSVK